VGPERNKVFSLCRMRVLFFWLSLDLHIIDPFRCPVVGVRRV
jgi:hypothetical protein